MDSMVASHLNMALYPKAVALTVWTFFNFLAKQTAQDIVKALGFNSDPPDNNAWQAAAINHMKEQGAFGSPGKQAVKAPSQPDKPQFPIQIGNGDLFGAPPGGESQVDPRIQAALKAASLTFAKTWQPARQHPTRGCIRVDGLVELQGNAAVLAIYVVGWYDPKQAKFMGIQTGLKHLLQRKQRPAGDS